jgi:hypothetical protein
MLSSYGNEERETETLERQVYRKALVRETGVQEGKLACLLACRRGMA